MTNDTDTIRINCGKCYKLDRRRSLCERHGERVLMMGPNTWLKCGKCIAAQKEKDNGKRL